jgi:hypothetical protein
MLKSWFQILFAASAILHSAWGLWRCTDRHTQRRICLFMPLGTASLGDRYVDRCKNEHLKPGLRGECAGRMSDLFLFRNRRLHRAACTRHKGCAKIPSSPVPNARCPNAHFLPPKPSSLKPCSQRPGEPRAQRFAARSQLAPCAPVQASSYYYYQSTTKTWLGRLSSPSRHLTRASLSSRHPNLSRNSFSVTRNSLTLGAHQRGCAG